MSFVQRFCALSFKDYYPEIELAPLQKMPVARKSKDKRQDTIEQGLMKPVHVDNGFTLGSLDPDYIEFLAALAREEGKQADTKDAADTRSSSAGHLPAAGLNSERAQGERALGLAGALSAPPSTPTPPPVAPIVEFLRDRSFKGRHPFKIDL